MKKQIIFFIALFFYFYSVYSFDLKSLNGEVYAGETFIAEFEADLKSNLKKEDLKVYEERREVYFEKGIFSYKNKTFIYVVFPKKGNFSIQTDNLLYYENGTLMEKKINKIINVEGNKTEILQISPGVVIGNNLSFSLSNKGNKIIKGKFQNQTFELNEGESKNFFIKPEKEFFYLNIESYKSFKIPVVYFPLENETKNNENKTNNKTINESIKEPIKNKTEIKKVEINESLIEKFFEVNKTEVVSFYVKNLVNEKINLLLKCKIKNLNFSKDYNLSPFEERDIFLFYSPNETGNYEENLTIFYENESLNITLKFFVITKESLKIKERIGDNEKKLTSCQEINGTPCSQSGFTCKNGNNVPFVGIGFCCIGGECVKIEEVNEKKNISNYVVGVVSFIILIIIVYLIIKKYKKVK